MSVEEMARTSTKPAIVTACCIARSPTGLFSLRTFLGCGALLALQGCAYAPPYPANVLDDADPWINSIRYLSDAELQRTCAFAERVLGCGNLTTGEIFVLDDPALSDCVLQHERSHFREVFVERVAYEESAAHAHWYDRYCAD